MFSYFFCVAPIWRQFSNYEDQVGHGSHNKTAAIRKSSWLTRCKVPKCDLIASQEMYDTARKIEDNLEMYWCLSRNDKKVTDFGQETQCVEDAGI